MLTSAAEFVPYFERIHPPQWFGVNVEALPRD